MIESCSNVIYSKFATRFGPDLDTCNYVYYLEYNVSWERIGEGVVGTQGFL